MIDTDKYERMILWLKEQPYSGLFKPYEMADEMQLLLAEVKRLQNEPTVTDVSITPELESIQNKPTVVVDDYHKKGHLYVTIRFPDGEEYVGLVEKYGEGEEDDR